MDWTICSRDEERDYAWDNSHASPSVSECARESLAPAFEGSLTASRFAALLRRPGSPQGVMLCVSVSTVRKDLRNRPIRTMAFLRAKTPKETELLSAFFAECLRKPDADTLYDTNSGVAKAVESLYQTKKADNFLRFCRSLPVANGSGAEPTGRYGIPRDDANSRQTMAESLPALIEGGKPFLIALTDRLPTDVLASLGSMFDHATIRIFSKAVSAKAPLPGGTLSPRVIAAAIAGAVVLLLVAAVRSCRGPEDVGDKSSGTNIVGRTVIPTNAVPHRKQGGESTREIEQGDSPTNSIQTGTETSVTGQTQKTSTELQQPPSKENP